MRHYSDEELTVLLNDIEADRVERKESFSKDVSTKARQAVCAFANDLPNSEKEGILFIGAKDDGTPSDLSVTDELLRNVSDMKTDGRILPSPTLVVQKRTLNGADMAVVIVAPSDIPPVKFDGRTWVRTGPRRSIATAEEERILSEKRRFKDLPFDLHPVPSATLDDLSRSVFETDYLPMAFAPDVLESNGRSYEEKLASCRFVVSPEDTTPTVSGILALGKSPEDFIPGAYIQFLRIRGKELTDPVVDELHCNGALVDMIRMAQSKFDAWNRISYDIENEPTHRIERSYPAVAFQQILYNAVLHRSYENIHAPIQFYWFDDRIEINSPGGPFGRVSLETFGIPGYTDYRNPNLASAMKTFGFVQQFGRGIALARKAMADNGNRPPEFQVSPSSVTAILPFMP